MSFSWRKFFIFLTGIPYFLLVRTILGRKRYNYYFGGIREGTPEDFEKYKKKYNLKVTN
jgi:hypothetical protein